MSTTTASSAPVIRAPHGTKLRCKGWQQEAALRCLMNNLDPEVAEAPEKLVVYGGIGKAARNWECYHAIVRELERLGNEETLLVQSGKPVGVFPTHEGAPRVLIANSNLVGAWANWDEFHKLDRAGLIMFGQMTAELDSHRHPGNFAGDLSDIFLNGGSPFWRKPRGKADCVGRHWRHGRGAAVGLTMNGAVFLGIDPDRTRIERRLETGYCDKMAESLEEALQLCEDAKRKKQALSVCLEGNCAEVLPELVRREVEIDVITDQTSAHDPLNGYIPAGYSLAAASALRQADPVEYVKLSMARWRCMWTRCWPCSGAVRSRSITETTSASALSMRDEKSFDISGFTPEYIRPLFCEVRDRFAGSRCREIGGHLPYR